MAGLLHASYFPCTSASFTALPSYCTPVTCVPVGTLKTIQTSIGRPSSRAMLVPGRAASDWATILSVGCCLIFAHPPLGGYFVPLLSTSANEPSLSAHSHGSGLSPVGACATICTIVLPAG